MSEHLDPEAVWVNSILVNHRPAQGMKVAMGQTCQCGYWTGEERPGYDKPVGNAMGSDGLDWHRAQLIAADHLAAVAAAVDAEFEPRSALEARARQEGRDEAMEEAIPNYASDWRAAVEQAREQEQGRITKAVEALSTWAYNYGGNPPFTEHTKGGPWIVKDKALAAIKGGTPDERA